MHHGMDDSDFSAGLNDAFFIMNNNSQSTMDPSENSTLEGSAFSVYSMSMSNNTNNNNNNNDPQTRDFSRHSMALSSTTDGATTVSSLSDGTPLRARRALQFPELQQSSDDNISLSGRHLREQKQRRLSATAKRRRRRPGGPPLPSMGTTTGTTGMTSCEENSAEEESDCSDQNNDNDDDDDDENDIPPLERQHTDNSILQQEEEEEDMGSILENGSGMTRIAPPSPKPQIKRHHHHHHRQQYPSVPPIGFVPADFLTHADSQENNNNARIPQHATTATNTNPTSLASLVEKDKRPNTVENAKDDDNKSVVSVSAKNLQKRKQRRQQSFKKRPSQMSAYQQLQMQQKELKARQDSIPDFIVPPPQQQNTRISALLNHHQNGNNNNNNSARRRPSYMEDVSSLANSTIATREEDDDDSELVLSPIAPTAAATWSRLKANQQPNKIPQRKSSMNMTAAKDAFSVVSEEDDDDDDDDDDDESLLSPLKVTLPQEKIQEALHKLHMSQPNLVLPLTGDDDDDDDNNNTNAKEEEYRLKLRQRSGTTTTSRRNMFQKAKSVSHLGLERKLQALPAKGDDDDDDYDFLAWKAPSPTPTKEPQQRQQQQSDKQEQLTSKIVDDFGPTVRRRNSTSARQPGNTRSLSPLRNRWISGCKDGLIEEDEANVLEENQEQQNHDSMTGWQLATSEDAKILTFHRASPPPTTPNRKANSPRPPASKPKPKLAKCNSTPNLFANDDSPAVNNNNSVPPLPAEKIESIVSFLLGEGLAPAAATTEDTKIAPTLSSEDKGEMEGHDHDEEEEKDPLIKHASDGESSTQDTPSTDNSQALDMLFRFDDNGNSRSIASSWAEDPKQEDAANQQSSFSSAAMPGLATYEQFNQSDDEKVSPSLIKKIRKSVKNVGQAGTRYLRKKKAHSLIMTAAKDEMARLSQSMTSFEFGTSNHSSSGFIMEKVEEQSSEDDERTPAAKSADARKETSEASSKAPKQRNPGGKRESFKLPKKLRGKRLPFMRSSSVPVLEADDGPSDTFPAGTGVAVALDQTVPESQALDNSENDKRPTTMTQPISPPKDSSSRGSVSLVSDALASPVGTVRRKTKLSKSSSSSRLPGITHTHSSPVTDSPIPRRMGKDTQRRSAKGPSLTSSEATDQSSAVSPATLRTSRGSKQRPKRSSTVHEKRSRSRTRRDSNKQRSKSASSRPRKEKTRRSSSRSRKKSPSGSRQSHLHSSLEGSFQSFFESDSSNRHYTDMLASKLRDEVRRSRRETNSPRASFRRHASLRNVEDRSVSTRKSMSSATQKPRRNLQKAKSSRDVYPRRNKSRVVDEASTASSRPSKRGGKMRLARQAKSERFLHSSASSIEGPDEATIMRNKTKAKRGSTSRGRSGSYTSLLATPVTPSSSKKQVSNRHLVREEDTTDSDQGMQSTPASSRRSVAGSRSSRPPVASGRKRMGKSQSLRHVPDLT
ncbi:expressed unknown protein [Seminavis robusta]|uniref:Uncharacterized protein n=1 Tax=Seminavis robusta TaxID=568900 RepID=A0A9N8E2T8_9STRA|nr:expressed unknown protein [Seminavis robusta]|eukprot:Sro593_g172320.1 n/a (1453) ;mRNA; f:31520-35878